MMLSTYRPDIDVHDMFKHVTLNSWKYSIISCSIGRQCYFSTIFRHLEANTCRNFELEEDFG